MLAVGSRDNNIYIYNVSQNYKLSGICRGHSSFISHIDWNQDNTMIQTNDGAYELLYWNAETCKQHTSSYTMRDAAWATWTCTMGWPVQGVWRDNSDGTDVNSCHRSSAGDVVVTADDFGMVRLFPFPALRGDGRGKGQLPQHKAYRGHMSHVMNVRFLSHDTHVISAGGNDCCVFQWRHINADGSTVRTTLRLLGQEQTPMIPTRCRKSQSIGVIRGTATLTSYKKLKQQARHLFFFPLSKISTTVLLL